jgi:hypothetical protein
MNENFENLCHDIELINDQILNMEHFSLTEAYDYLQARAISATGTAAFSSTARTAPKKPSWQAGTSAVPGRIKNLNTLIIFSDSFVYLFTIPI